MTKSYHITFSFHIFSDLDYVPFENKCIVLLQTVLEWSHEKYAAVFNSYSDNIAGRSFRSRWVDLQVQFNLLLQLYCQFEVKIRQKHWYKYVFKYPWIVPCWVQIFQNLNMSYSLALTCQLLFVRIFENIWIDMAKKLFSLEM